MLNRCQFIAVFLLATLGFGFKNGVSQAQAFWSNQQTSASVRFHIGDWQPPVVEVKLVDGQAKEYLVDELVEPDCYQTELNLSLTQPQVSCQLKSVQTSAQPQWLHWRWRLNTNQPPWLLQPVLSMPGLATTSTGFNSGVDLTGSESDWHQAWLPITDLGPELNFELTRSNRTLPTADLDQTQVQLQDLSTSVFFADNQSRLLLHADETVEWQVDYQVGQEAKRWTKTSREVELPLQSLGQVIPDSWQIKAVDLAHNESSLLQPIIYTDAVPMVSVNELQFHLEADHRLTLKFRLNQASFDQVLSFKLRQKLVDGWHDIDLIKVVPFVNQSSLATRVGELVVLTTSQPVEAEQFCLFANSVPTASETTLECFSLLES